MNSKDRKGVAARVWAWVQSQWLQPDGNICQVFIGIAGLTLVLTLCFDVEEKDIIRSVPFLVLGLLIAYLVKNAAWSKRKLSILRNVLLDMAFQECRCDLNAIIIDAHMEPELVGKLAGSGYCHVCQARAALKEQFPGAIETEIRERLGEYRDDDGRWVLNNLPFYPEPGRGSIPKDLDLAAYLSPVELEWHNAAGQLPEAHQAKPQ